MASKNVINRQKSTRMVVAAVRESKENVETGLTRDFNSTFAKAVVVFFAAVATFLERITEELVAADRELYRERDEDSKARAVRDQAVADLRSVLITLQEDVRYMYGDNAANELKFGTTPSDPDTLLRYARTITSPLPTWVPPTKPRVEEYRWKGKEAAARIEERVKELEEALEFVAREKKQTDARLAIRNRHRDRHTKVFSLVATLASQVLSLIGEDELSRKVRPSSRRAGNTEVIGVEDEGDETEELSESTLEQPSIEASGEPTERATGDVA